ncbi:hypothetical protein FGIG_12392 [Fasciola gigantica]|uniref:Uncharacterized protein n=1 Tax=Fasciola gigantica TaxID=46835 RepID=A0A504YM23_FASGI|nr:hypothetical protein FGIG_12392 [Fasciola gigantica]
MFFTGDHKKRFKELKFCHPLWFEPPDPRTRARLFYDMVAQFYFCNEQSDSPVETTGISSHCKRIRTNAVVEHRSEPNIGPTSSPSAPSKSTRVRTRSVGSAQALDASKVKLTQHHSDQKGTNSKSRHQNSSHPTSESLVRRSSRLASTKFAKLPKNSNNHRPDEPVNSDEADEAEFGDLSIDISTDPEEKDK